MHIQIPEINTTIILANTKHLYNICTTLDQRRRRWADVVQMLYKCFVFAGMTNLPGQLTFELSIKRLIFSSFPSQTVCTAPHKVNQEQ